MSNNNINLNDELNNLYFDENLLQKIDCSPEENLKYKHMIKNGETLPNGIYMYNDEFDESYTFYSIHTPVLSPTERFEYITLKQLKALKTIKNCVVFFTVLAVISMVVTFISILSAL